MRSPAATEDEVIAPGLDVSVFTPGGRETRVGSPKGHVLWTPAVTDDAYLTVGNGGILTANPRSRSEDGPDWFADLDGPPHSGPVATDDVVLLVGPETELVAVDYETGDVRWRRPLEGEFGNRPAVSNGAVFVGTDAGTLYAIE